jgi:hypothetical protein
MNYKQQLSVMGSIGGTMMTAYYGYKHTIFRGKIYR